MTDTLTGFDVHLSFDGANAFVAGNVDRRYSVTADDGSIYERRSRAVVSDVAASIPSGDLIVQVQTLTAALATMTADRDAKVSALGTMTADRDAAAAQVGTLTTELAAMTPIAVAIA